MAAAPYEVPGVDQTPRTVVLELTPEVESAAVGTQASAGAESQPAEGLGEAHGSSSSVRTGHVSTVPEGKGPLYKCAICAEFVYESQLEYHVTICPDPNDSSSLLSTPGAEQPVIAEPDAPAQEETYDLYRDEVLRESLAVSEASQRMWAQWSKDSKLAEHHNVMVQRSSQKRNQLLDELRKKEAEECTFQPKTLSRGSPRTFSRPDTTGEVKWEQRLDQRKRDQRLKQVEAQHYAELTLKPKISPFAQAWSQKQAEAVRESPSTNSVFERLYQAALQQEEKQTAAKRERDSDQAECLSPPPPISNRSSPPRRIPTSELLYSDALDRRERLRIMTEQMQLRREEETKEHCAVLYKSSRLYYQLIEKQIKAAFDGATNGQAQLAQASLEDFLVRFKCMRPRKNGEVAADDLESARLQAALWRHLDPNKVGHTDLKTVTLFFHVLMGAVDDAVQNAGSAMEEPGASPSKSTASEGGSIALQSINEEGFAEAVDKGDSVLAALSKTAGIQEDEDRRLVELLLRFDPLRLRTEFQPLLLHRMHYQGMAAQAEQERSPRKEEGPNVVNPVIDAQSRSLAEKLLEKQRSESGKATHAELLFWRHKQVQARKESLRKQLSQEEEKGCTFRPKCNPSKPKDGHVEIQTPPGSSRSEVLYARGLADKERRKAKVLESEKARSTAEARGCTFRPNLSKSVKSYHKTQKTTQQVPRGFYETRQRIRAAYEIREKVLQQQEDRMAKIEQTVPYQVSGTTPAPLVGKSPLPSTGYVRMIDPSPAKPAPQLATPGPQELRTMTRRLLSAGIGDQAQTRTSFQQEGTRTEAEGGGLDSQPAAGDEGNAEGNASPKERAQEDIPPDAPPMLYVDVNITQGQPAERIVLYQGQNVSEVAAEFAAKHVLTPALAQKLHTLLREVVLKQELQNQA
ncbi:ftsH3, partial [Symbiodinium necroappetens]